MFPRRLSLVIFSSFIILAQKHKDSMILTIANDFLAFAFSPDCQHVAIVSVDGCLRIVDFLQERCKSYHLTIVNV